MRTVSVFLFSFFVVEYLGYPIENEGELVAVSLLFRHGDRPPITFYPNDPYQDLSFWPVPPGELTNIGKKQHFKVGQWFRNRYNSFLSAIYDKDEIHIWSSNNDRCLMSALADLAGLYPPIGKDVWNEDLSWQPIPVHTSPEEQDDIAEVYSSCPIYNSLKAKAEEDVPYFKEFDQKNKELYAYISEKSGQNITGIVDANYLFDTLHIETIYNYTLPDWALEVYPSLKELGDTAPKLFTATPQLTRLFIGRYFYNVLEQFNSLANETSDTAEKFRIFSGHDDQVFSILSALQVENLEAVPYAAVAIFELRKSAQGELFVQLLYKTKEDVADVIQIPNCDEQCSFDQFVEILQPIALSKNQFDTECAIEMSRKEYV